MILIKVSSAISNKKRRRAGLIGWDGMYKNYQLDSFQFNELDKVLSIFFADEYVNIYAVKTVSLQSFF